MQRVPLENRAQKDKFGQGKHGFQSGNPSTGVLATIPGASFFDSIQEELAAVVEQSGDSLDTNNNHQVIAAIKKLIAANVPASATDKVAGITKIIDRLDSDDALAALSARQGKALFDGKLDKEGVAKTALYAAQIAARKIGGVTFNAKSDIDLPGVNIPGNQDTSGNANSATKLKESRLIGGIPFDGTQDISIIPAGAIQYFSQSSAPAGWLKANGAAVSRKDYANLFAAIGTMYGTGDGNTTFNLPDFRGEFFRCWDDGRGLDKGRSLGSWQDSENKSHQHTGNTSPSGSHQHTGTTDWNGEHTHPVGKTGGGNGSQAAKSFADTGGEIAAAGNHAHSFTTGWSGEHTHSFWTEWVGGAESRPRNVALLVCIKY